MTNPENPKSKLETENAKIYASYGKFADAVRPLAEAYTGFGYGVNQDPAFVNKGQNSAVFIIQQDDMSYVVKIPTAKRESYADSIDTSVEASNRVINIPGYERIVAASAEGAIVSEKIEGTDLADISPEELSAVTDNQIDDYVQAIIEGHSKGISIDPKPANVIYNIVDGFTIIDFGTQYRSTEEYKNSYRTALSWGIEPFIYGGRGDGDRGDHVTDPNKISEIAKLQLLVIEKYLKSVEKHLGDTSNDSLFPNLESAIERLKREAFDMEGLIQERKDFLAREIEKRRNYDPAKHGKVDEIF